MKENSFKNQVVIVTGGTRGIGLDIAKQFYKMGASVYRTSRSNKKIIKGTNKKNFIKTLKVDFLKNQELSEFIKELNLMSRVDVLINNAGINIISNIEEIAHNDWEKINHINLKIPFMLSRIVIPKMKKNKYGRIINISSIFSEKSKEKRASYSSSKAGLNGLTRASAIEVAKYNILINSISPGFVKTQLTKKILTAKEINLLEKQLPIKRFAEVRDISKLVVYLSGKDNTYLTGQNVIIDGGFSIK